MELVITKYIRAIGKKLTKKEFIELATNRSLVNKLEPYDNKLLCVLSPNYLEYGIYNKVEGFLEDLYDEISELFEITNRISSKFQESVLDWILLSDVKPNYAYNEITATLPFGSYYYDNDTKIIPSPFRFNLNKHINKVYIGPNNYFNSIIYLTDNPSDQVEFFTQSNNYGLEEYMNKFKKYGNKLGYYESNKILDLYYYQGYTKVILNKERSDRLIEIHAESALPYIDLYKDYYSYYLKVFNYNKPIIGLVDDFGLRKKLHSNEGIMKYNILRLHNDFVVEDIDGDPSAYLLLTDDYDKFDYNKTKIYML